MRQKILADWQLAIGNWQLAIIPADTLIQGI
jgi:hypothetical protein